MDVRVSAGAGTASIIPAFTNTGLIQLNSATANLTGGAITSSGTIQGFGSIADDIVKRRFILGGGLGQIGDITGNGLGIYYDPAMPANAYLGGATYPLAGGGTLAVTKAQTAGAGLRGSQPGVQRHHGRVGVRGRDIGRRDGGAGEVHGVRRRGP